jgi:hypothetical protein
VRGESKPGGFRKIPQGWFMGQSVSFEVEASNCIAGSEDATEGEHVPKNWSNVRLEGAQLEEMSTLAATTGAAEAGLSTPAVSRGGRPATYDWEAFAREVVRVANTPDGLGSRSDLTKHMQEWCMTTWGCEPSESQLRAKIRELWPQSDG